MRLTVNKRIFVPAAAALLALVCGCATGPRHGEMDLRAGKAAYESGDYIAAAADFDRIITSRPDADIEAAAYAGLGASYMAMHNYGQALTTYRLAVKLHPKKAQLMLRLAALYYRLELYPEAIEVYKTALKLEPDNVAANLGIARTYMRSGYLVSAARHYKNAMAWSSGDYRIRFAYADCLFRQRSLLEAETEALNALSLNRGDPDIWFLLARIQFERGAQEPALRSIETAGQLSGGRCDIESFRLMWLSQLGRLDQSLTLADALGGSCGADPLARWVRGQAYLKGNRRAAARELLGEAAAADPDSFIGKSAARVLKSAGLDR